MADIFGFTAPQSGDWIKKHMDRTLQKQYEDIVEYTLKKQNFLKLQYHTTCCQHKKFFSFHKQNIPIILYDICPSCSKKSSWQIVYPYNLYDPITNQEFLINSIPDTVNIPKEQQQNIQKLYQYWSLCENDYEKFVKHVIHKFQW